MSVPEPRAFQLSERASFETSEDLRRFSASAVMKALLLGGPMPRAAIADQLGMARATVTKVSGQLIDMGLVREGVPNRSSVGRPRIPLELDGEQLRVITVHVGANEVRFGIVDIRGDVVEETRSAYVDSSPAGVAALITSGVAGIMDRQSPIGTVIGISSSIGGWVDPLGENIVRFEPLGWEGVPFASLVPDLGHPRYFDQMVRGLALAESMFGAAKGVQDFLQFWTGNILGAAIVSEGHVHRGPRGAAGSIEAFPVLDGDSPGSTLLSTATDIALVKAATNLGILRPGGTMRTLIEVVRDGDPAAMKLLAERARQYGHAAAVMADLVSPELVVIGGLATTAPGYSEAFIEGFRKIPRVASTPVVMSRFGDLAPTVASASLLLDAFYRDPLSFGSR